MPINTGRFLLLAAGLAALLSACGGGAPEQFLTLKLEGKPLRFDKHLGANDPPSEPTVHFVTVGGHLEDDPSSPGFMFQLVAPEVKPGTYRSGVDQLYASYYVQTPNGTTTYTGDAMDGASFVMTVTAMDADGVQGTFSGRLRLTGGGEQGPFLQVEDGRFSARYNGH
ncbi:hypothetical protein MWN52_17435 [Pseudoxanthomonas winnipegensis]|uniref:hypothetical protein n=1 Tax=Pseudoxanthomonas winnipegensis TaxID=2480810 RepID=UPI0025789BEA|nr:hypothetical protein [Pseudoxanthomonas winnipegensis]WJI15364.1 hypothetical protein MWN52_17435 [Pseudoxanthomonas winnipegensis]